MISIGFKNNYYIDLGWGWKVEGFWEKGLNSFIICYGFNLLHTYIFLGGRSCLCVFYQGGHLRYQFVPLPMKFFGGLKIPDSAMHDLRKSGKTPINLSLSVCYCTYLNSILRYPGNTAQLYYQRESGSKCLCVRSLALVARAQDHLGKNGLQHGGSGKEEI